MTGRAHRKLALLMALAEALKTYGLIAADNGSNWFTTGAADSRWSDTDLNQLKRVPGYLRRGR
jgi:hypothetical protein